MKFNYSINDLPIEVIEELVNNPVFFARVVFDTYLWSKQREILWALKNYKFVVVYSGTGTGKSHLISIAVPYFLQTYENIIIPITSPNYRACIRTVWKGVREMYAKARIRLMGEPTSTKWEITKGTWYAEILSARKIEALQGIHSAYQCQILEEASGIEDWVFDALDGNLTGGENYRLVVGNPLRPEGEYFKLQFNPKYYKVKISVFDTPLFTGEINEIPEPYRSRLIKVLPTPEWVDMMRTKYGEDSAFWKSKILAEFPTGSETGLFSLEELDMAFNNENPDCKGEKYLTIDVARYGTDKTVMVVWEGFCMKEMIEVSKANLAQLAGKVINLNNEYKFDYVIIDGTGLGAGLVDILEDEGLSVHSIQFTQNAFDDTKYANIQTEMFFKFKEAIQAGLVKLKESEDLKKELLAMEYTFDAKGRLKVVDSHKIRRKIGRSPDHAIATALRFTPLNFRLFKFV